MSNPVQPVPVDQTAANVYGFVPVDQYHPDHRLEPDRTIEAYGDVVPAVDWRGLNSPTQSVKRRGPGRPKGSKNKKKVD